VYQFVWHELCDWYIELAKDALYGDDAASKRGAQAVLVHVLATSLRLLHPFMPFITEELWHHLRARVGAEAWPDAIMAASYPATGAVDEAAERRFGPVLGIIEAIRNVRGEMNIPFKVAVRAEIAVPDPETHALLVDGEIRRVQRVAGVESPHVILGAATPTVTQSAVAVGPGFEVRVPLAGVVDVAGETARIDKEIAKIHADLESIAKKLANPSFVAKAPPEVVEKDRARAEELREKRGKLEAHRAMLSGTANPARRDTIMQNQNEPKMPESSGASQSSATPAPGGAVAEAVEKVATAASDIAKAAASAVMSGLEELKEKAAAARKARRPAKKKAKKAARKPARKAKKAPRKAAARKAKKPARKPARKAKRKARR
jgi:valyl-tRNA synthetase